MVSLLFCFDWNTRASACPALQVSAVHCWEVALGEGVLGSCNYLVKAEITLLPSFFAEADSLQVSDIGQPDAALCRHGQNLCMSQQARRSDLLPLLMSM